MSKSSTRSAIRLRGVRHNNLKNIDLDLPLNQLIVVTGLSGSGKSSLAFDTLFAEGQRRYIETFSPYARQFLDRMDKPQVDSIEGIPPAIAIEQRNSVRTTRSTVGTMTEICDYMKLLWPHVARLHCRQCSKPVQKDSPQQVWQALLPLSTTEVSRVEFLVTFDIPLTEKLSREESLALVSKQGYQRLLVGSEIVRIDDISSSGQAKSKPALAPLQTLTVIQDRLMLAPGTRSRFIEACEQAYHFGKGKLAIRFLNSSGTPGPDAARFSNRLHCAQCDIEYREPSPALFSFNHPLGACPTCRGFGRVISIDYSLALPDRSKTLAQGVVKPWQTGMSADCQRDLLRMCKELEIPTSVPFDELPEKWQDFVINGEPDYGKDEEHQWPRAWYGIKGYFRWLESKAYKMHVRVLLSRYRAYSPCPACGGMRFQPDSLLYRAKLPDKTARRVPTRDQAHLAQHDALNPNGLTLADFYNLPIRRAVEFIEQLVGNRPLQVQDPIKLALGEVRARVGYLNEVGLGYLTLNRPTRSLSGGETERVSLTTCLGTRLVNTLFVLDEPSVGLHPRDTERLIHVLEQLRNASNTVVVVEHEAAVMRAADQIVDLGPGHGATGGEVVFQGSFPDILRSEKSLTGQYLSGTRTIETPQRRPIGFPAGRPANDDQNRRGSLVLQEAAAPYGGNLNGSPALKITGARLHNLKNLSVQIPLQRFVCVTGVSGSGKTTLIREVLFPALCAELKSGLGSVKASDRLDTELNDSDAEEDGSVECVADGLQGSEYLDRVVLVDQSILAKTPRSNPAVYIGAFDDIRELYALSDLAKRRGLNASAFSFNSAQGQCERCRGAGFEKIEMQFLSDIYIRCPDCDGQRYRSHILQVKIAPPSSSTAIRASTKSYSIADLLNATVDEVVAFLEGFSDSRPAARATKALRLLQQVGLGYLRLGQPINTLSGGESQRLKLVRHLAEAELNEATPKDPTGARAATSLHPVVPPLRTLFLFDEPTTGLHFDDVRVLLKVFQRLVDAGQSIVVIEHNLDVIKSADWIIDLGPEAGDLGGQLVSQGTPEQVAANSQSFTGQALTPLLGCSANASPRSKTASRLTAYA